jgi:hypothetical protein
MGCLTHLAAATVVVRIVARAAGLEQPMRVKEVVEHILAKGWNKCRCGLYRDHASFGCYTSDEAYRLEWLELNKGKKLAKS